jgi:hypothetical protein
LNFTELEEEEASLPNGINIFPDKRFGVHTTILQPSGKNGWECEYCHKVWNGLHVTKALVHISKTAGKFGIAPCGRFIPSEKLLLYKKLHSIRTEIRERRANTRQKITD